MPNRADYLRIALEAESVLHQDVLSKWFPYAVDKNIGGFHQFFGEDWRSLDRFDRGVVYQSRLTWVAARATIWNPDQRAIWAEFAHHGADFLADALWDSEHGGFWWTLNSEGQAAPFKHVYGIAFAIYALASTYRATGDEACLKLACRTFEWLETHSHDDENGGYYEALFSDGRPILSINDDPDDIAFGAKPGEDAIGTDYGFKSMNTHIHLLEAFSELMHVWPDSQLRIRLLELFEIVRDRIPHPNGYLHLYFSPSWQPRQDEDSYGHDIETAYLLTEAAEALGIGEDDCTWRVAKSLVDHTLDVGWDTELGGVYMAGDAGTGPRNPDEASKGWWEQAESLNALLLMHERYQTETDRYWETFTHQWSFIQKHQLDSRFGGWHSYVSREGEAHPGVDKSDAWVDPYHQARALMNVIDRLQRLALVGLNEFQPS